MIKCHLSRILGERRITMAQLERETGIGRNPLGRLYNETYKKIDIGHLNTLCEYFEIELSDLIEYVEGNNE